MKLRDLHGQRFGRLLVLEREIDYGKKGVYWKCLCDCGKECVVLGNALVNGHTKSCGCYAKEVSKKPKTHGLSNTSEHAIWKAMRQRCYNANAQNYHRYGGRGIKICKEWHDFKAFYIWCSQSGFKEGLTIDRIDNNGDYCPENCRWVDKVTQGNNKSNNRKLLLNGELISITQVGKITGIDRRTISYRLNSGWTDKQCVEIKPKYGNRIVVK